MLYVTTRDKGDAYTFGRALSENRGPDGGLYVPYKLPRMNTAEIQSLKDKNFGQCVADVLNLFFLSDLTGWDIDFCVGRNPAKLIAMNYRIFVAEAWHNHDWIFSWYLKHLIGRIRNTDPQTEVPSAWAWTAVRIATIFGVFGELMRSGVVDDEHPVDLAVASGDFSLPLAGWYAREMGLPIGTIIFSDRENGTLWDLFNYGKMHTDAVTENTDLPESDYSVPPHLEAFIFNVLGLSESQKYTDSCRRGRAYVPSREAAERLRRGMFAAVVSQKRMESIISSVDQTNGYLPDPYAALAFGGLQDYRAKTGECRPALIWSERSPGHMSKVVTKALGITEKELQARLDRK